MHQIRHPEERRAVGISAAARAVGLNDEQRCNRGEWEGAECRRCDLERARIGALRGGRTAAKDPSRAAGRTPHHKRVQCLAVRQPEPRRGIEGITRAHALVRAARRTEAVVLHRLQCGYEITFPRAEGGPVVQCRAQVRCPCCRRLAAPDEELGQPHLCIRVVGIRCDSALERVDGGPNPPRHEVALAFLVRPPGGQRSRAHVTSLRQRRIGV